MSDYDSDSDISEVEEFPRKLKKPVKSRKEEEEESEDDVSVHSDDDEDADDDFADSDMEDDDDEMGDEMDELNPNGKVNPLQSNFMNMDYEEEEEDGNYLQKFDEDVKKDIISEYHPELKSHNYHEVLALCRIVKDDNGKIVDPLHKTLPFLTKYERARILGERAKQLNSGAEPFIAVEAELIDGYLIAQRELEAKKIPFILKRPLPDGGCEYWRLKDLENLF
jgi:DNA-directed RNA polymerase I, II, and III subunit RPABC2